MNVAHHLLCQMVRHARDVAPLECCGLIACLNGEAVRAYRATNAAQSEYRYEIAAAEQYELLSDLAAQGLELGGVYHSHLRTEARPSQVDLQLARGWPGIAWVIVSLADCVPEVRAWRIEGGQAVEEQLEL